MRDDAKHKEALKQALYLLKGYVTELPVDQQASISEIELKIKLFIEETLANYDSQVANFGLAIASMLVSIKVSELG